jgi:hypothetical protein
MKVMTLKNKLRRLHEVKVNFTMYEDSLSAGKDRLEVKNRRLSYFARKFRGLTDDYLARRRRGNVKVNFMLFEDKYEDNNVFFKIKNMNLYLFERSLRDIVRKFK